MASVAKPVFTVQVRQLVEFALRRGDLGGERDFVGPNRSLAGIRGHQKIQRSRPPGYQKEVPVSYAIENEEFVLCIQGRIDGVTNGPVVERRSPTRRDGSRPDRAGSETGAPPPGKLHGTPVGKEVVLEEIKTVQGGWGGAADPLHWAQVKCYGFIYGHDHGLPHVALQLTYLDLESGRLTEFHERFSAAELATFFHEATAIYLEWIAESYRWRRLRDESIRALSFPFPRYRPGQRDLAVAAYRALAGGGRLFVEAPTGIGKTISVLFPALKALGEGKLERLFYLTARTIGRTVAEKALADLRRGGLRLRALTLTAKEKICAQEGQPCDPGACPFARGYYDRYKPAMRAALEHQQITRPVLEAVSRQHQVCPFELSLDLSLWVDAVICDYNYVFDPKVYLRRHFADEPGEYGFLIDEAHNLVDRAREMFSADLDSREIQETRRALKPALPRCARSLGRLSAALRQLANPAASSAEPVEPTDPTVELNLFPAEPQVLPLENGTNGSKDAKEAAQLHSSHWSHLSHSPRVGQPLPAELLPPLDEALKEAETWLARNEPAEFRESLLELYFRLHSFRRTAELYDEHYVTIIEAGGAPALAGFGAPSSFPEHSAARPASKPAKAGAPRVRLFCLDPSFLLRQALARGKAAVCFSATLTPLHYYRELLGGSPEDPVLQLASPFPPENLALLVQDRIRTHFKARAETLPEVAQAIGTAVGGRPGNYLVYFPSYAYLNVVQQQFQALHPQTPVLAQRPGMSEAERESFLAAFAVEHEQTLVGFAVMGGIFGEGIDLVGDRLIGAIIVGVGLPQLCIERDLIRDYFQERTGAGFDYAYTFPGMNRVLQATGRVIRSETDRGMVLLIDTRFAQPRYRQLFPPWWQPVRVRSLGDLRQALNCFWQPPD